MIPFVFVSEQMEENDVFTITESIVSRMLIGLFLLWVSHCQQQQSYSVSIIIHKTQLFSKGQKLIFIIAFQE